MKFTNDKNKEMKLVIDKNEIIEANNYTLTVIVTDTQKASRNATMNINITGKSKNETKSKPKPNMTKKMFEI